ncbi:MAG: hypothetical protein J0H53_16115 [Rhizobiales bacterium]|nr:hypothetical protein [Hyphomicrobiales bacterium]OJU33046.1 MAG: hypothetical protein BGN94_06485 [Rhizobiales bacterium 68-8]
MLYEHDRHERASRDLWYRLTYETEKENQRRDAERRSRVAESSRSAAKADKSAAQGGGAAELAKIVLMLAAMGCIIGAVEDKALGVILGFGAAVVIYRFLEFILLLGMIAFFAALIWNGMT